MPEIRPKGPTPTSLLRRLKSSADPITTWIRETLPGISTVAKAELAGAPVAIRPSSRPFPDGLVGTAMGYRLFMALGGAAALDHDVTPARRGARQLAAFTKDRSAFPFDSQLDGQKGWMSEALSDTGDEHLARVAFALALYEEPYKNPPSMLRSPLWVERGREAVLALAKPAVVSDIVGQMKVGAEPIEALGELGVAQFAVTPVGAPTVGNAEVDLLLGTTLVELKSTVNPSSEAVGALQQVIAYALLDYTDEWGLTHVGVYLSRSGRLARWDLADLLTRVAGEPVALSALRASFQVAANQPIP